MSAEENLKRRRITRSARAGLQFPVGRIDRLLHKKRYILRVAAGAPIYLTAVMEYLAAELIEISGEEAQANHKKLITPRHLRMALRNDKDFMEMVSDGTITRNLRTRPRRRRKKA